MNADLERIVGKGQIVVELLGKEAAFRQLAYNYPLKLLSPKCRQQATAIAYMVTYGGGLVGGDSICLDVSVKTGVTLVLLTQGSTKVFETRQGNYNQPQNTDLRRTGKPSGTQFETTVQRLNVNVDGTGVLLLLPDPVTCFSNASYKQAQTFHLNHNSSAVILDWLTSGRMYNDEQWKFLLYHSLNEVWVENERVARDAVLLDNTVNNGRTLHARLEPYSCYAMVFLCGPKVRVGAEGLLEEYRGVTVFRQETTDDLIWSIAQIRSGHTLRIAGKTTEIVKDWLKKKLKFLEDIVGEDVYGKAFL